MRLPGLSDRQDAVLALLLLGRSRQEIGAEMGISTGTVNTLVNRIGKSLGVSQGVGQRIVAGLLRLAVREGWLVGGDGQLRVTFPYEVKDTSHRRADHVAA